MIKRDSNLKRSINRMTSLANHMPKTVNEAINFGDEGDGYEMEDAHDVEMEAEPEHGESKEESIDWMGFVDDIRKKSLMGMAKLADNPDDPGYDVFKRLWQICDKAYNDQKQASGAMQQQGQMQQPQQQPIHQIPQRPM